MLIMTTLMVRSLRKLIAASCLVSAGFFIAACDAPDAAPVTHESGDLESRVDDLLAEMTLAEKIGQMTQAEITGLEDPDDVATYFLGSVLSGGGADPATGNDVTSWTNAYEDLQRRSLQTRLGIPILYGVDAVHGHNNVLGAVIFPHNIGLGATRNADLVEEIARITAIEVRATGINWNFAPCVCVARDIRWGRTYEAFSEEPTIAGELGAAAVRGYQTADLSNPLAVLASAKHYVGDGGTAFGTGDFENAALDQGDMQVSEDELREIHLPPFYSVIEANTGTIMPSYSSWNGEKLHGHEYLLTTVLKEEMGYEGFLISDYNGIQQVHPDFKTAVGMSINAGMDMAMMPNDFREFIEALTELVEEGEVPMTRIDDAVRRILRIKFAMGLMEEDAQLMADPALLDRFGSPEHREVARQAVRESLVLLSNEGSVLPLAKDLARIHVAGKSADDIGNQSGGWTIEWLGASGNVTTGGTTILEAIRNTVGPDTEVTFSLDGSGADGADVVIVVIGETPYAEGYGDVDDLALAAEDIAAVEAASASGAPVVTILISGRPMILGETLDRSAAFIAAWLPGTEGTGVTDILFGDYAPTGKLSFTWPRSMEQVPLGAGIDNPLYEWGYGLTY